jgi:hypothetical protein
VHTRSLGWWLVDSESRKAFCGTLSLGRTNRVWRNEFIKLLASDQPGDDARAYQLKDANLPPSICKYRGPNDLALQNLRDGTVWLSSATRFNDPYDSSLSVDLRAGLTELFRQNLRDQPPAELSSSELAIVMEAADPLGWMLTILALKGMLKQDEVDRLRTTQTEQAMRLTGEFSASLSAMHQGALKACSFSTDPMSLVMWANYADCHRGFCMEYATSTLGDGRRRLLFPVIYTPVRFSLTDHFMRFIAAGATPDPMSPAAQHLPAIAAMHKSEQWSYEREWRLLCVEPKKPDGLAVRMPLPKALHLGCRMAATYRTQVLEAASAMGIPCYEAALAGTTFSIEPRRISL